ncbi:MAG: hypothetical protein ABSH45_14185 [Bryobacteraceae bacterium]|jgi:transposase-like protein
MTDSGLSPQQLEVIDALSSGVNLSDAAAQAGVDCATIAYWRRNFPRFHAALAHAQYDRALMFRERAEALADLAFETLRAILTDPKASPSVRLKAAIFVIEKAVTPAPPKPDKPITFNDLFTAPIPEDEEEEDPEPQDDEPEAAAPAAQKCTPITSALTRCKMHKSAQARQPGRHEPCSCGSCRKYKRSYLGQPLAAAA